MAAKVHSARVLALGEITRFLETMREGEPGAEGNCPLTAQEGLKL